MQNEWAGEKKPSMKRRCEPHDYCERGIYMITIATERRLPLFGVLRGNADIKEGELSPHVEFSPLGERVRACWLDIARHYPAVEPMKLCIMPDHIHGVLFVHERLERHLGHIINGFKAGCRKAARELGVIAAAMPQPTGHQDGAAGSLGGSSKGSSGASQAVLSSASSGSSSASPGPSSASSGSSSAFGSVRYAAALPQPQSLPQQGQQQRDPSHPAHGVLWEPGYHDRILRHKGQLGSMFAYMDDNPRRLLLKRQHPKFFTRLGTVTVANTPMQAIGNRLLLDHPLKVQVQCSRSLSIDEIAMQKEAILHEGAQGSVLVSPCISPGEQQIASAALSEGIPLIVLLLNGFSPFYKPSPRYLKACTEGRLLMLAPFPFQNEKIEDMRERCLQLNAYAMEICKDE